MALVTTMDGPSLHRIQAQNSKNRASGAQATGQLSQKVVVLFSDATPSWMLI
jgi:hypothetical protein